MGPHEPYWQTNTSFSPPPSRWDFRFQSDGLQYGSHNGFQLYGSSASSNSTESKSWVRGNVLYNDQYSASDSAGLFLSSPLSQGPQWTPPAIQEITIDDYETPTWRDARQFPFTPALEGTSGNVDSRVSPSSCSDSSESEPRIKSCISSHHNVTSSCLSFMSKPLYPLSFPSQIPFRQAVDSTSTVLSDYDSATRQREPHRWSSASSSSIDLADVSEPFESEGYGQSNTSSNTFKCGLCQRFLSQRSPLSSRRIVRTGDMPVVGVLSCRHVFHADCLEHTTPKTHKNEPPCPLCLRLQEENFPDQQVFSRIKNGFPRLRPSCEDGPSRPWSCAQVGDCVEGALHVPSRNTMLLLNRNCVRKKLSLMGNSSKEFPGKLKKTIA